VEVEPGRGLGAGGCPKADSLFAPVIRADERSPEARKVVAVVRRLVGTVLNEELAELWQVKLSYLRSGGLLLMPLVRSAVKDRPENVIGGLQQSTLVLTGERDRFSTPALGAAPCAASSWQLPYPLGRPQHLLCLPRWGG